MILVSSHSPLQFEYHPEQSNRRVTPSARSEFPDSKSQGRANDADSFFVSLFGSPSVVSSDAAAADRGDGDAGVEAAGEAHRHTISCWLYDTESEGRDIHRLSSVPLLLCPLLYLYSCVSSFNMSDAPKSHMLAPKTPQCSA